MGKQQFFGIKYPFTNDSVDNYYLDLNETQKDMVQSELLHIIFTQKGQKLRDPEFGTNLIKYIFEPNDDTTSEEIQEEITRAIHKYLPMVEFEKIDIYNSDNESYSKIVSIDYSVKKGNTVEKNNVSLKI